MDSRRSFIEWYATDKANIFALLFGGIVITCWVEGVKYLANRRLLVNWQRRKLLHVLTGVIYILIWPLFSSPFCYIPAYYYAVILPITMTIKFFLVGIGFYTDDDTVLSASRTGNRLELLKGPCQYGVIFILSTIFFWRSVKGVICLCILCFGDGFAEIVGRKYGSRNPLPWSKSKSWAGYGAFVVSSFISVLLILHFYGKQLFCNDENIVHVLDKPSTLWRIVFDSIVAGLVETLPLQDVDNITVFIAAILADNIFLRFIITG